MSTGAAGECARILHLSSLLLLSVVRADRCIIMALPSADNDDLFRVVCVRGPLYADGVQWLIDVVGSYAIEGYVVELDLSAVTGLDMVARSALWALIERAQAQGWHLHLTGPGARPAQSPAPPARAHRTRRLAA